MRDNAKTKLHGTSESNSQLARKRRGLGNLLDELDDEQKDWVLLAIGLFVIAPLFYFLFYW